LSEASIFEAVSARIDVRGTPVLDDLTATVAARRALVLGGPRALFEAAIGTRALAHGQVLVFGDPARRAVEGGILASAPLDPPLPPRWTAKDYVTWSARLAGHREKDAIGLASEALARLGLAPVRAGKAEILASMAPLVRRRVVVAAALATGARVLFLEDPSAGLDGDAEAEFASSLIQSLGGGCAWLVFAPRVHATSPWLSAAEEAVVLAGAKVAAQGSPSALAARVRTYAIDVLGEKDAVDELARRIEAKGGLVNPRGRALMVDLADEVTTLDLLAWASEADLAVVEIRPVARAFS
jgi:ABC-2 type transport system ATP-binding protein